MVRVEAQEAGRRLRLGRKWRIAHKLTAAPLLMILLILLTGGVGLWQVLTIGQAFNDVRETEQQRARSLELLAAGRRLVASLDHMLLTQDAALMSTDIPASLGTLTFNMEALQQAGGEPETVALITEMQAAYGDLLQAVSEVNVLARQERWAEVDAALEQEVRPLNKQMNLLIRRLVQRADRDVEAVALRAQAAVLRAVLLLAILTVLTTVIAWGWRRFVFRDLILSITELRQGVMRISSGDLEHEIDIRTGDEIEELGVEFNKMADELAGVIGSLEQRVADRTRGLQAAAEVARATTSVLDLDELLQQVVNLARERFNLYHVGLALLDEERRFAVLRSATGEAGREMMEEGLRLQVGGNSMVGWCTAHAQPRVVPDVRQDTMYSEHPLLPDTRSAATMPLIARGRVIGALNVESAQVAAFDEADVAVMQTLADQVAVAIDNARLFAETQAALAEMEATQRRYMGRTWAEYKATRPISGYERTDAGVVPLGDEVLPKVQQTMAEQSTMLWSGDGNGDRTEELSPILASSGEPPTLAVPITLRGQPIGVLGFTKGEEGQQWSEDDIALAEALTEQFVLAADNLRLLDETQRRAARERLTGEVTTRMRETLDVDTVLQTAVREMRQALGLHDVTIQLGGADEPGWSQQDEEVRS